MMNNNNNNNNNNNHNPHPYGVASGGGGVGGGGVGGINAALPAGGGGGHPSAAAAGGGALTAATAVVPRIPRASQDRHQCLSWSRVVAEHPSSSSPGAASLSSTSSGGGGGPVVPPPRSGAASVVVKGRLYVFGGYGGGTGRLDDFYSFNFSTGSWEEVQVLSGTKPGCRENNGVVISDSSRSIYLFGGYNGNSWLNDLWKFDIESKEWTCIQESTDQFHHHHYHNNNNNNNNNAALGGGVGNPDVGALDESNIAAVGDPQHQHPAHAGAGGGRLVGGVSGKIPSRRFGYVSVVHEGKFVLFGGFDGSRWLNDMYVFDFDTRTWTEIAAGGVKPTARSCPAWAKDDTHVYIQGGYDGVERKADFFACDLTTYTWTEMPCLGTPPSPRYFHSCCLYGNKMYLYGGYSGNERLADMYAYDFETNHWSQVDCSQGEAPSGRSSLVAQVYENCLYIFGGYNGSTVLNDFYKFRLKPIGVPPPALVNDLSKLIDNPELSDVCFRVEGKVVHANRSLLAIRSEYFRVMLCGGMRESMFGTTTAAPTATATVTRRTLRPSSSLHGEDNEDDDDDDDDEEDDHTGPSAMSVVDNEDDRHSSSCNDDLPLPPGEAPIPLLDVPHSVFLKVLEFLYTDTVKDVGSLSQGIQLLIAGEQFMLDRLKALCEDTIRRDIDVDNVVDILVAAHRHHATGLKDIALDFILRNLQHSPRVMEGLDDLKSEPDLLLEIIKRNAAAGSLGIGVAGVPPGQHQQHQHQQLLQHQQHRQPQQQGRQHHGVQQDARSAGAAFAPGAGPFGSAGAGGEWNARR